MKKWKTKMQSPIVFFMNFSLKSAFFIFHLSFQHHYFFLTGSQVRPQPSFLKILRSTSESMTVEWT